MIGALRYEFMRIRTIRSSYWLSAIAIALTAAITLLLALTVDATDFADTAPAEVTTWVMTAGASFAVMPVLAAAFYAVIGVMAMGHEYRYGTNKATLSALPDRITVLLGKVIVLALWITVTVAVTMVVTFVITVAFFTDPTFEAAARPVLAYWSYCLGFGLAGFGLTAIVRNQTGAMVMVLVWPFVIEPIVNGIIFALAQTSEGLGTLSNFLPASAGRRTMFDPYLELVGFGELDTWGLGPSFVVFWVGVLGLCLAGTVLFIKRDA